MATVRLLLLVTLVIPTFRVPVLAQPPRDAAAMTIERIPQLDAVALGNLVDPNQPQVPELGPKISPADITGTVDANNNDAAILVDSYVESTFTQKRLKEKLDVRAAARYLSVSGSASFRDRYDIRSTALVVSAVAFAEVTYTERLNNVAKYLVAAEKLRGRKPGRYLVTDVRKKNRVECRLSYELDETESRRAIEAGLEILAKAAAKEGQLNAEYSKEVKEILRKKKVRLRVTSSAIGDTRKLASLPAPLFSDEGIFLDQNNTEILGNLYRAFVDYAPTLPRTAATVASFGLTPLTNSSLRPGVDEVEMLRVIERVLALDRLQETCVRIKNGLDVHTRFDPTLAGKATKVYDQSLDESAAARVYLTKLLDASQNDTTSAVRQRMRLAYKDDPKMLVAFNSVLELEDPNLGLTLLKTTGFLGHGGGHLEAVGAVIGGKCDSLNLILIKSDGTKGNVLPLEPTAASGSPLRMRFRLTAPMAGSEGLVWETAYKEDRLLVEMVFNDGFRHTLPFGQSWFSSAETLSSLSGGD